MTNVIKFTGLTKCDLDAVDMLEEIAELNPVNAFVVCWPKDGSMPTFHSNTADMPVLLMRLQQFIHDWYGGEFRND